jgi:tetratricopeptide (TPR) repeat protein
MPETRMNFVVFSLLICSERPELPIFTASKKGAGTYGVFRSVSAPFSIIPRLSGKKLLCMKRPLCISWLVRLGLALLCWGGMSGGVEAQSLDSLYGRYMEFYQQGRYAEAVPYAELFVDLVKREFGSEHESYGVVLNNLAVLYERLGDYGQALPLYLEALDNVEKALGKDHLNYEIVLNNLAGAYSEMSYDAKLNAQGASRTAAILAEMHNDMGDYAKALVLYEEALDLEEKISGKSHAGYGKILHNLAGLYERLGDYAKALPLYLAAWENAKETLGRFHPDHAKRLQDLARMFKIVGDYDNALPLYLEALENIELLLGKSHPIYGEILYNLADLYESMGNYEKALPLYLEVLKIEEQALSKPDSQFATRLHKLGILYYNMGDYQKAKEIYEMTVKYTDEDNMGYAMSLNNLAAMYSAMGDYDRALSLYLASSENIENTLGKSHPSYGTALNNLATLYSNMGHYASALPLLLEAIEIAELTLGKSHPDYSARLSNLAALYLNIGEYGRALPLYEEALEQTEKALGKSHPGYTSLLLSLSKAHQIRGDTASALSKAIEALEIAEKSLGKSHPDYTRCTEQAADLYEAQRNFPQAIPLLRDLWESAPRSDGAPPSSFTLRLAHAYKAIEQYPASDSLYAALLKTAAQGGGDYIQAHLGRGEMSRVRGDFVQAAEHLDSALVALDQRPEPALRLRAYAEYAALYKAQNHWSKADSLYTLIQGLGFGAERLPEYATMLFEAAAVKMHMGQTEEADRLQQECKALTAQMTRKGSRERKNHALFFCTDQYKDSTAWDPLKNAISDGEALAAILHDKYGFDTLVHRNLGLDALIAEIKKTFKDTYYQADDHLFLFFAGHGYFDETVKMGSLVTHDTKKGKDASYFSYTLLEKYLADNHPCKHIFLVIDACFSGTFFESIAMRGDTLSRHRGGTPTDEDGFIRESITVREGTRYASRHALTSSGKETVSDGSRYSPFAEKLLELLRTSESSVLTPADFEQATRSLNPAPKLSTFKGHEVGGNFFLLHTK